MGEYLLGNYIREYRQTHKLSLRDFGNLCGISHTTIDCIEKGFDPRTKKAVNITNATFRKLSEGMGIPTHVLVGLSNGDDDFIRVPGGWATQSYLAAQVAKSLKPVIPASITKEEEKPTPVSGDAKKEENEHYGSLNDLYYNGVLLWIDKGFFSADEQTMLKEHFWGVLSRYKELIDRTSGIKRSLKIHMKAMAPLNSEMNSPLSAQEIAEQFLKQELMREISSLTSYIDAYAFHFAHTVIKENLAGQVPSEEMDRQREQWEVENYRKCLISEQLQAEQQKKPTPVDEGELLELFKMYVERLSPDQLQMIFDQARSMWEQNKVRDQMQRMIGQQKAPSSVAVRQITDETAQ